MDNMQFVQVAWEVTVVEDKNKVKLLLMEVTALAIAAITEDWTHARG